MKSGMNVRARIFLFPLAAILVVGCQTTRDVAATSYHVTRDVAVGSYRVATAPAHYVMRRHGDQSSATTTETTPSDVTTPGQPVPSQELASVPRQQPRPESNRSPSSSAAPRISRNEMTQAKPKPSSTQASASQMEFPTAKSVPGKPGYVVSPFDSSGRYVDVSGYVSGSKVKDPWTDKIFIVP